MVFIVIDTLRADRLGCYGYHLPTTPNIDALAAEATLFEQAATCAPLTLPSLSAMLTSTYPAFNNVRYNGIFFLGEENTTLAEILKRRGYETAAFIGGFPLDSMFGTDQGFDVYDDDFSNSPQKRQLGWIGHRVDDFERTGAEVNEKAFSWLEKNKNKRFFLMAHYFDSHLPYKPPSPYAERFASAYDGEVAYADEQVGRLLEKLEELGLRENTLVVLTADHGEALGEHEEITHGEFVFDTTIMVPLIIYHSERVPKGHRVETLVRNIDIMPTILDFLDIPSESGESARMQGISLVPALEGEPEEIPALLEATLYYYESESLGRPPMMVTGLRTGEWKLVYKMMESGGKLGWTGELYNLAEEPPELTNLRAENPAVFNGLLRQMQSMLRIYSADGLSKDNRLEMDKETRDKLRSLGYFN